MNRLLIFSLLLTCQLVVSAMKPAKVLVVAGQSNTDGRCPNVELPVYIKWLATDTVNFSSGAYRHCKMSQNRVDGMFEPFWPQATKAGIENSWAYDAVTYYWMEQAEDAPFYVIKWAVGGTSIAVNHQAKNGRFWSADLEWLKEEKSTAHGGRSLLLSLAEQIEACVNNTLKHLKEGYQVEAIVWHQGESDYKKGELYYDNLKGVFDFLRACLTEQTGHDYSHLPIVLGTVAKANKCYNPQVEQAMKRLASEDENIYVIDMSRAGLLRDRLHFNAESAVYMGLQVYNILQKLQVK